ncbi:MAG: MotA/TolQ/ExbB proton channel family protein [Myxococcales bacterium]|nr:MotA/TolQ/ExbB proton channel family protein [Myxococcales bacterium]
MVYALTTASDPVAFRDMIASLQKLVEQGGPTLIVIAVVAAIGFAIFIERWLALRDVAARSRALDARLRDLVAAGRLSDVLAACNTAPDGLNTVLTRGIEAALRSGQRDAIFAEMSRDARRLLARLRRGLGMLATLGTMSPFLGLFGTVLGIMQALRRIGETGASGLEVVASGVSEALIDTAAGILVAICMVLLHQLLKAKVAQAVLEVQILVEDSADAFARLPDRSSGPDGAVGKEAQHGV